MQRLTEWLGEFVAQRQRWAWALVVVVTIPAAFGWSGYRLFTQNGRSRTPTEEENTLHEVRESFHFVRCTDVLALECEDFFQPKRIAALRELTAWFEDSGCAESLVWIGKIPKTGQLQVASLLPSPDAPQEAYQRAREEAAGHPLVAGHLLSPDGKTMLMLFPAPWDTSELKPVAEDICADSGIRVRVTGRDAIRQAYRTAFAEDHLRIVATACILVVILATIIFRGPLTILIVSAGRSPGSRLNGLSDGHAQGSVEKSGKSIRHA